MRDQADFAACGMSCRRIIECCGLSPQSVRLIYEFRGDTACIHVVCDTKRDLHELLMQRIVDPA